jgi:predicted nucleic-acid-binding protein
MSAYLLDANVVLRFLRKDNLPMWRGAHALFEKAKKGEATLELDTAILAEVIFTLLGFYRQGRTDVADAMLTLVTSSGVEVEKPDVVVDALRRFKTSAMDFHDTLIAALAAHKKVPVASFDRDLDRFKDITRFEPKG